MPGRPVFGKNRHEEKEEEVSINDLNSPPQKGEGHEKRRQTPVGPFPGDQSPSKKHHNQGGPDPREKDAQKAVDGEEIATEHKDQTGEKGTGPAHLQVFEKEVEKKASQKEMENNNDVEGPIKGEEKQQTVQRIEEAMLRIREERIP